jgi:pimeloyl-ACP methyl ester carboxylesterase
MVRGHGSDIVLVHGALGDYRQWQSIVTMLSRGHRVIAMSRRFHWPNLLPAGGVNYTYEGHSADLEELVRSLSRPAHLVGHSYGAGVALLTALRRPTLVRSLTLIEPPFASLVPPTNPEFAGELASRDSMVAAIRASVRAGAAERAAEVLIDWVQGGVGGFRRLPRVVRQRLRANEATVGVTYAAPAPQVTCEQLRALKLPVFILRGERTRPWYRLIASAAAGCLPDAEAAVVPAAAHMTIAENPRDTARLVADFIARREAPKGPPLPAAKP